MSKVKKDESKQETGGNPVDNSPDQVQNSVENPVDNSSVDSVLNSVTADMPQVQDHAIETVEAQKNEEKAKYAHLSDSDGIPFDPNIHRVNPKTGEPTVSKTGKLMRKPGRSKNMVTQSILGGSKNSGEPTDIEKKAQAVALGRVTANLISNTCVGIFQDEAWHYKPADKNNGFDEREYQEKIWADYYEATGRTDLPPGFALAIGLGSYVMPRFNAPKTQQKTKGWITKAKLWWKKKELEKEYKETQKVNIEKPKEISKPKKDGEE